MEPVAIQNHIPARVAKAISIDFIAKMNRDYLMAQFAGAKKT